MRSDAGYSFSPVRRADLPMLRAWLAEPHVRRWWGDPDTEVGMIAEEIGKPESDLNIVAFAGEPFAYVQSWDPHAYGLLADQPAGTRGIDPFIGVPSMIGKGHGATFLRAFAERLFDKGAPRVTIDPDPSNEVAIRA
jgi:aminoglycoside 6'-N-acetyltransferase